MQQWEYKIVDGLSGVYLDGYGKEGWEYCGYYGDNCVFKRPIGPNWKERCEAAEAVIATHDLSKRIKTTAQSEAWKEWMEFKY